MNCNTINLCKNPFVALRLVCSTPSVFGKQCAARFSVCIFAIASGLAVSRTLDTQLLLVLKNWAWQLEPGLLSYEFQVSFSSRTYEVLIAWKEEKKRDSTEATKQKQDLLTSVECLDFP